MVGETKEEEKRGGGFIVQTDPQNNLISTTFFILFQIFVQDGARVVKKDVMANNGVIHFIDKLIIPKEGNLNQHQKSSLKTGNKL